MESDRNYYLIVYTNSFSHLFEDNILLMKENICGLYNSWLVLFYKHFSANIFGYLKVLIIHKMFLYNFKYLLKKIIFS